MLLGDFGEVGAFGVKTDLPGSLFEVPVEAVTCNAENRPIRWQSGDTVIAMAFGRMAGAFFFRVPAKFRLSAKAFSAYFLFSSDSPPPSAFPRFRKP